MTRRLLIVTLVFAAIVGCVRSVDLHEPDPDASPLDAFQPVPDAFIPVPDASPLDADLAPDAS